MHIQSSQVALHGAAARAAVTHVHERWEVWCGTRAATPAAPPAAATRAPGTAAGAPAPATRPTVTLDRPAPRPARGDTPPPASGPDEAATTRDAAHDETLDPRLRTLARIIEAMTGLRVRVFRAEALQARPAPDPVHPDTAARAAAADGIAGWGLAYDRVEIRIAAQTLSFEAQGRVVLADGSTVTFRLGLTLQSTSIDVRTLALRAGDAVPRMKDPLVLSLDGAAPTLAEGRFAFDLDADGTAEAVPFVAAGSGFLALDHNGNGAIDDGRELFGALSGDGFADLAALDADGNGWIDAADPMFERLLVWTRDGASGGERLRSAADAGVGALYLGRVGTPFALGDAGRLRSSGLYLTGDGTARGLHQIDLAV